MFLDCQATKLSLTAIMTTLLALVVIAIFDGITGIMLSLDMCASTWCIVWMFLGEESYAITTILCCGMTGMCSNDNFDDDFYGTDDRIIGIDTKSRGQQELDSFRTSVYSPTSPDTYPSYPPGIPPMSPTSPQSQTKSDCSDVP